MIWVFAGIALFYIAILIYIVIIRKKERTKPKVDKLALLLQMFDIPF